MQHRIDTVTVNDDPMEVFMYLPDGDGPNPGIVLAMHIPVGHTGIENDTFTMKTAERYAKNGFAVVDDTLPAEALEHLSSRSLCVSSSFTWK